MEADQVTLNYEVQLEDYGKECERFKEEAKQKSDQLTAAEESLRKKEEECRMLQELHGKKMAEYGDLQQKHVEVEDDNTELQSSVKQITQECTELQKEKDELQSSLANAHLDSASKSSSIVTVDELNKSERGLFDELIHQEFNASVILRGIALYGSDFNAVVYFCLNSCSEIASMSPQEPDSIYLPDSLPRTDEHTTSEATDAISEIIGHGYDEHNMCSQNAELKEALVIKISQLNDVERREMHPALSESDALELKKKTDQVTLLQSEIAKLKVKTDQVTHLQNEIAKLKGQMLAAQSDMKTWQDKFLAADAERDSRTSELLLLKEKLQEVTKESYLEHKEWEEKTKVLEEQEDCLKKEIKGIKSSLQQASDKASAFEREKQDLKVQIEGQMRAAQSDLKKCEVKLQTAQQRCQMLEKDQDHEKEAARDLKAANARLTKEKQVLESNKSALNNSNWDKSKLENEKKALEEKVAGLEKGLTRLKAAEGRLAGKERELRHVKGDLEKASSEAIAKEPSFRRLQDTYRLMEVELYEAKDSLLRNEKELKSITEDLKWKERQLKEAKQHSLAQKKLEAEMGKTLAGLETVKMKFKSDKTELEEKIALLQDSNRTLETEKNELEEDLKSRNDALGAQLESLKNDRRAVAEERDSLRLDMARLVEEKVALKEQVNQLEDEKNRNVTDAQRSLDLASTTKQSLQASVTKLTITIQDLTDKLSRREVELNDATAKYTTTKMDLGDRLESLELKLRLKEEEVTQLRATIERNEVRIQDTKEELRDLEKYRKRVQDLRNLLREANTKASEDKTTISELETKRNSQTTEESQQRQDIEGPLLVEINTLKERLSQRETDLQSSNGRISELERDIDASKAHSAELQSELKHTSTELTSTLAELNNTHHDGLKKAQEQNEASSSRCQELEQQCQELRQHIAELESVQDRLQKREEDLNQQVEVLKFERDTAQRQAQDFDRDCRDLKLKLQKTQSDYENEQRNCDRERDTTQGLRTEISQLIDRISSLEREVQALKEKGRHRREVMQQVVKSMQAQVAAVRSDLDQERSRQSDLKDSVEQLLTRSYIVRFLKTELVSRAAELQKCRDKLQKCRDELKTTTERDKLNQSETSAASQVSMQQQLHQFQEHVTQSLGQVHDRVAKVAADVSAVPELNRGVQQLHRQMSSSSSLDQSSMSGQQLTSRSQKLESAIDSEEHLDPDLMTSDASSDVPITGQQRTLSLARLQPTPEEDPGLETVTSIASDLPDNGNGHHQLSPDSSPSSVDPHTTEVPTSPTEERDLVAGLSRPTGPDHERDQVIQTADIHQSLDHHFQKMTQSLGQMFRDSVAKWPPGGAEVVPAQQWSSPGPAVAFQDLSLLQSSQQKSLPSSSLALAITTKSYASTAGQSTGSPSLLESVDPSLLQQALILPKLMDYLPDLADKGLRIAGRLNMQKQWDSLASSHPELCDRLQKLFAMWLEGEEDSETPHTWGFFISLVQEKGIDQHQLARKICSNLNKAPAPNGASLSSSSLYLQ